jgi:glucokinase
VTTETNKSLWAIDIGGTTTRIGVVDHGGAILATCRIPTPANSSPGEFSKIVASAAAGLRATRRKIDATCGVAMPGILEHSSTRVLRAVNLPWLEGFTVREIIRDALGVDDIAVHNDVLCAGYAQWRARQPEIARFAYLSIGTGVAACVILDGRPVQHTRGGPGHFGHVIVDTSPTAPRCRCGGYGCLEACVGGWAITERGDMPDTTALTTGLLQLATMYAPEHIAIGGGVAENHPDWIRRSIHEFDKMRTTITPRELTVSPAALPADQAGLIGAALLALDRLRGDA